MSLLQQLHGLIGTSIYNILSSNVINLLQYLFAIFLNKNQRILENRALRIDLSMVVVTIIIPIILLVLDIEINLGIVPIFIILFALFYYINANAHKLYLKKETKRTQDMIEEEEKYIKGKKNVIVKYLVYLILTGIALFVVGNLLSGVLENLCRQNNVPELVVGVALGFVTSLPELITFFESQKHYAKEQDNKMGVVEATNNLLTSNLLNLFIIQTLGIILYAIL